jgi:hypothetical protein
LPATLSHVSEEDAFDIMLEALSRRPAAADDKAQDNLRGVIDTTAQRLADNEPATGGPSIEGYTPGPADKVADVLASNVSAGPPTSLPRRWQCGPDGRDRFGEGIRYVPRSGASG